MFDSIYYMNQGRYYTMFVFYVYFIYAMIDYQIYSLLLLTLFITTTIICSLHTHTQVKAGLVSWCIVERSLQVSCCYWFIILIATVIIILTSINHHHPHHHHHHRDIYYVWYTRQALCYEVADEERIIGMLLWWLVMPFLSIFLSIDRCVYLYMCLAIYL